MTSRFCIPYTLLCVGVVLTIGGASGCQSDSQTSRAVSSTPASEPPIASTAPQPAPSVAPITFQVKVDSPVEDLKIRPGAFIRKGQIVANPEKRRASLATKKQELEIRLEAVTSSGGSIPLSTQREEETVALAQKQVETAQSALQEYKENSPWTDFARSNLPLAQEEVQLNRLTANLQQAQNNLKAAKARLADKQAAIGSLQQQQNATQKDVQASLAQIESQLSALKPVKSAHTGTVTKLDVAKSVPGQPVTVTVSLLPGESPQPLIPNADSPQESPLGLPNLPSPPETGSPIDLLPPSDVPSSSTIPNPSNSTDALTSPPLPNTTLSPNSGTE